MAIPADISEVRARMKREQRTVFSIHRWLTGISDPVVLVAAVQTEDKPKAKKPKAKKVED